MELTIGWKRLLPLIVVVSAYLCVGALIFKKIEGEPEIKRRTRLTQMIAAFLENHTCLSQENMHEFVKAIGTETEFTLGTLLNTTVSTRWDFTGAFSFVVSVVTTIGYGNLAPHTELGKVTVMAYALIGIPLTLLMLKGLGQHLTLLSRKVNKLNLFSKRPAINKYANMVIIILLGISMLFLGPTFLFMYVEQWTWMEALYYCFVTLSTIGFGDYIAALSENRFSHRDAGPVYRIVAYVWILFGLSYLALVISYISNVLVKKAEKVEKMSKTKIEAEIKRLQKEVNKTKGHFLSVAETVADTVMKSTGVEFGRKTSQTRPNGQSVDGDTVSEDSSLKSQTNQSKHRKPEVRNSEQMCNGVTLLGYKRTLDLYDNSVRF